MVPDADGLSFKNVANGVDNAPIFARPDSLRGHRPTRSPPWTQATRATAESVGLSSRPTVRPPTTTSPRLIETGRGRLSIRPITFENRDPALRALDDGAPIRIVLWSMAPNDLRDVRFVLEHWSRRLVQRNSMWRLDKKQARIDARWERQRPRRAKRAQRRIARARRPPIRRPDSPKPNAAKPSAGVRRSPLATPSVPEVIGPPISAHVDPGYWHGIDTVDLDRRMVVRAKRVVPHTVPQHPPLSHRSDRKTDSARCLHPRTLVGRGQRTAMDSRGMASQSRRRVGIRYGDELSIHSGSNPTHTFAAGRPKG